LLYVTFTNKINQQKEGNNNLLQILYRNYEIKNIILTMCTIYCYVLCSVFFEFGYAVSFIFMRLFSYIKKIAIA